MAPQAHRQAQLRDLRASQNSCNQSLMKICFIWVYSILLIPFCTRVLYTSQGDAGFLPSTVWIEKYHCADLVDFLATAFFRCIPLQEKLITSSYQSILWSSEYIVLNNRLPFQTTKATLPQDILPGCCFSSSVVSMAWVFVVWPSMPWPSWPGKPPARHPEHRWHRSGANAYGTLKTTNQRRYWKDCQANWLR